MSFTPPEAPPYPISPDDEHQDEEGSTAAYAEILVCLKIVNSNSILFVYLF
jgi:hypothetical protein